jgi:hypothetical protein
MDLRNIKVCVRIILLISLNLSLGGCVTERLQSNTENVGLTTTDIYYHWVLQNVIRAYVRPGIMPCGITLSNGTISINMTSGLTAGYSESYPAVTPSAGINGSSVNQQTLGISPVTDGDVLSDLKDYFDAARQRKLVVADYTTEKQVDGKTKVIPHHFSTATDKFIFSDDQPAPLIPAQYYCESFAGKTVYVSTDKASLDQLTALTLIFMRRIAAAAPNPKPAAPAVQDYQLLR